MASVLEKDSVKYVNNAASALNDYDCTVIIGQKSDENLYPEFVQSCIAAVKLMGECDASDDIQVCLVADGKPRLVVWSPTGPLNRDYDDVRRYKDAALNGIKRALKAGKKKPLLVVDSADKSDDYKDALLVSILGAFEATYVPIEVREALPEKRQKVEALGIASNEIKSDEQGNLLVHNVCGIEHGRIIARDIGGSDPERMAAGRVEEYLRDVFNETSIKMTVVAGHENFKRDYPLFAAVDRCADGVHRHRGRIIYLEYNGEGDVQATHMFVGKGVTYDTGGADIKAGGHMAGMHRDKCGAATIGGIFGMLEKLKPKGIKVVGRLAMVRNSCGSDAYVADEIITSAAGARIRIGNTDAEGRMAMSDPLHHTKLQALNEVNPHLYTIATLTGHSMIAMGEAYSVIMDNGPARTTKFAQRIQEIGHKLSDPFEVSTIRREDFNFVAARNEYEDVIQCNNLPSSATARGHQFPAAFMLRASGMDKDYEYTEGRNEYEDAIQSRRLGAKTPRYRGHQYPSVFMIRASGLDKHGLDSKQPLKYTHVDIAGSSGPYPGIPTAAPLVAFAKMMNAF